MIGSLEDILDERYEGVPDVIEGGGWMAYVDEGEVCLILRDYGQTVTKMTVAMACLCLRQQVFGGISPGFVNVYEVARGESTDFWGLIHTDEELFGGSERILVIHMIE